MRQATPPGRLVLLTTTQESRDAYELFLERHRHGALRPTAGDIQRFLSSRLCLARAQRGFEMTSSPSANLTLPGGSPGTASRDRWAPGNTWWCSAPTPPPHRLEEPQLHRKMGVVVSTCAACESFSAAWYSPSALITLAPQCPKTQPRLRLRRPGGSSAAARPAVRGTERGAGWVSGEINSLPSP
jgi:hypothetical protein